MAHVTMIVFHVTESRDLYERVRAAYNLVRTEGSMAAPPFDEWRGLSGMCDYLFCRYVLPPTTRAPK